MHRSGYRSRRPFAPALAIAFGLSSAFLLSQVVQEETLAGPAVTLELETGCPPEYPDARLVPPGDGVDRNGDGIICFSKADPRTFVDNTSDQSNGARHVSGHGNFFDEGFKVLQDISFSFHGIASSPQDPTAKGEFEYHDQTPEGADLTVHGEVLCVWVTDTRAELLGVVTRSNDVNLPIDQVVIWATEDNGEGVNSDPDTITRIFPIAAKPDGKVCGVKRPALKRREVATGNIQVHEDETSGGNPTKLDVADEEPGPSDGVFGHGNFFDNGKKVVQDLSFSFHAIGLGADGKIVNGEAKGEFEYHDQTGGGAGLTVHGQVMCAAIGGNSATVIGRVTHSDDRGLPVDTIVVWVAEDNGEPGAASPDRVSRLSAIGIKLPKEVCQGKVPAMNLLPILSGNIQVR